MTLLTSSVPDALEVMWRSLADEQMRAGDY